jgi:RNA polymerase sigma-70 factor (ECF subfamily)
VGVVRDPGTTFDEVFEHEYARLLRTARLIVGDEGRAREIVQESFARALVRWDRIGGYDSPAAWLLTVTVRQAVRSRAHARREVPPSDDGPAHAARGPADSVEAHVLVGQGLEQLSAQQRAVVVLHYLEDLSVAEVADRLGVRPGTVKTQLSRARARLAEVLGEQEPDPVGEGMTS